MQIESILEDLEAQGYFATSVKSQEIQLDKLATLKVSFIEHVPIETFLRSPIAGKDFIAGFRELDEMLSWQIVPDKSPAIFESLVGHSELSASNLTLKKLLTKFFLDTTISITLRENSGQLTGNLKSVEKNRISIENGLKPAWISLSAVNVITVENFKNFL